MLYWSALAVYGLRWLRQTQAGRHAWVPVLAKALPIFLLGLMALMAAEQWTKSREAADNHVAWDEAALALGLGVDDPIALSRVEPFSWPEISPMNSILASRRWAFYSQPWSQWTGRKIQDLFEIVPEPSLAGGVQAQAGNYVQGWALDQSKNWSPESIVITGLDSTVLGIAGGGRPSPDLAGSSQTDTAQRCAWTGYLTAAPQGSQELRAYGVWPDGRHASFLASNRQALKLDLSSLIGSKLQQHFKEALPGSWQGSFDSVEEDPNAALGRQRLSGWAWDSRMGRQVEFVLLCDRDGRILALARGGEPRFELLKSASPLRWSRWYTPLEGQHNFEDTRAYAVLGDGTQVGLLEAPHER
jgi:hypothetical protein